MAIFLYLFLGNAGVGLIPDDINFSNMGKRVFSSCCINITKGILCFFLCNYFLDTQMAVFFGCLGLIIGILLSPWVKNKALALITANMGLMLVFMPKVGVFLLFMFLSGWWISNSHIVASAWSFFLLPFITAIVFKSDIYILISTMMSLVTLYFLIPHLERVTNRPKDSMARKSLWAARGAAVLILVSFAVITFFNRYVYRGFGQQVDVFRQGNPELKLVALTFDDGPDPKYTPQILDILKEYQVPATFFMVGIHVEQSPQLAKRIVEEGHDIGNHTYSHQSLVPATKDLIDQQILKNDRVIESVTGVKPVLFRPPRGVYNDYSRKLLLEEKYTLVLWDVSGQDWSEIRAKDIARNIIRDTKEGSILLLHDSGNLFTANGGSRVNTVKALPMIIEGLQEKGYTFVTISDMIVITGLTHTQEEPVTEPIPVQ